MRRASIVAALTVLLLATACDSGSDNEGKDDGGRPADSTTSADTSPSTDEESETADDAPPTEPTTPSEPTKPPVSHDPAKPTVTTAKRVPNDICGLLTAEDLSASGFGRLAETPQTLPDIGCAAEAAGSKFEGVVYGVAPAEPGGKAPTGPMKVTGFEVDGNTAFWGFYAETRTCTAAVALGKGRWAAVHIAREDITQDRAGTIKVAKQLIQRMFQHLPNA